MAGNLGFTSLRRNFLVISPIFLACVFSVWFTLRVLRDPHEFVYVWPLTGIQLGFLLPLWQRRADRIPCQFAGAFGVFLGSWISGLPFWFALIMGLLGGVNVLIAAAILSRGVRSFEDLKRRENLVLFVLAGAIGPVSTGLLTGIPLSILLHHPAILSTCVAILSDSLGVAIVLPATLFLLTGEYRDPRKLTPHLYRIVPAALFFTAVAITIFWQTTYPLLFVIYPPMVVIVLSSGLEGSVFISLVLPLIACIATIHGHGPFWLSRDSSPETRHILLQSFMWLSVASVLPVGALLDERRRAEREAQEANYVSGIVLENSADMIILSTIDGKRRYISAACERLTGWTPAEFLAIARLDTFHPDDREIALMVMESMTSGKREHTFRYRMAQKSSGWRWVEASTRAYFDDVTGQARGYVGIVRDISAYKQTEETWSFEREQLAQDRQAMAELALTDALTQLPNRRAFDEAIQQLIRGSRHGDAIAALMMIDIDHFKLFNDSYGHQAGDECLRSIAHALKEQVIRPSDLVARWGGEEFGVLLPGTDAHGALSVASSMIDAVRQLAIPHKASHRSIATISIGIATLTPECIDDPALWIQHADKALYRSKRSGRDRAMIASTAVPVSLKIAVNQR